MAQSEIPLTTFSRLNRRSPASSIEDDELAECINLNLNTSGELIKRYGFQTLQIEAGSEFGAEAVKLLGIFQTATFSRLVAATDDKVFYSTDGVAWTEILLTAASIANVTWGLQYDNKFYLIRSNSTIVEWDGAATASITGSPSGEMAVMLKERMFVFNSFAAGALGSRLYFSEIADVATAAGWPAANFIDVRPGDGDILISMAVYQDVLFLFKMQSTWGLYLAAEPEDWAMRVLNPGLGCSSKYALLEIEGFLYFVAARGVYRTDGTEWTDISVMIEPDFAIRQIGRSKVNIDSIAWWDDRLIIQITKFGSSETWGQWETNTWDYREQFPWGGEGTVREYWAYDLKAESWAKWEFVSDITPFTFISSPFDEPLKALYAGTWDATGRVYKQDRIRFVDVVDGVDTEYDCVFTTKEFTFLQYSRKKRVKWISIHCSGEGEIGLTTYVDRTAQTEIVKATSGPNNLLKFAGPGYVFTHQYKFRGTTDDIVRFLSMVIHLHVKRNVIKSGAI